MALQGQGISLSSRQLQIKPLLACVSSNLWIIGTGPWKQSLDNPETCANDHQIVGTSLQAQVAMTHQDQAHTAVVPVPAWVSNTARDPGIYPTLMRAVQAQLARIQEHQAHIEQQLDGVKTHLFDLEQQEYFTNVD